MAEETTRSTGQERRRYPRIEMVGRVTGQVLPQSEPVIVLDMSKSGFSMKTRVRYPIGAVHEFRLVLPDIDEPLTISAQVVHSVPGQSADGSTHYVSGLHFVDVNTVEARAFQAVIAALLSD
jgi:hypothetical protein